MDQNKLPTCWIPIVSQSRPLSYSWKDPIPAAFRICQKYLYCAIPLGQKSLESQLFWVIIMVIAMNIQLSQLHQLLSRVSLSLLRSLDFSAFFEVGWPKSPQSPPCRSYQRPGVDSQSHQFQPHQPWSRRPWDPRQVHIVRFRGMLGIRNFTLLALPGKVVTDFLWLFEPHKICKFNGGTSWWNKGFSWIWGSQSSRTTPHMLCLVTLSLAWEPLESGTSQPGPSPRWWCSARAKSLSHLDSAPFRAIHHHFIAENLFNRVIQSQKVSKLKFDIP